MRRFIFCFVLGVLIVTSVPAQLISPFSFNGDGLSVGLEKSKMIFIGYGKNKFSARMKQSLTADRTQYQFFRVEGGYTFNTKFINVTCDLFYSTDWYLDNYNIGSQISFISNIFDKYGNIAVRYVPYYDKELKFNNGWSVSGKINVTRDISFVAEYGSVPDFRIAYDRLYIGAAFRINNLSVYPLLEIPLYENEVHLSHSRMVVNMCYTFRTRNNTR